MVIDKDKQVFYVYFRRCDDKLPWWQRLLVPKKRFDQFSHCGVLMQFGCDVLQIDSNHEGVWFNKLFDKETPGGFVDVSVIAEAKSMIDCVVLKYESSQRSVFHCGNIIPTCVTMVKSVIGRASWELTPYQLYKGLINDGAEEINGKTT